MMRKDTDELVVIIALLAYRLLDEDPDLAEHFFYRLRRRLKHTESWSPELAELLEYPSYRDFPQNKYPLYRIVRNYLKKLKIWGPEIDELLEYATHRPTRRNIEIRKIEGVTRGLMREFTSYIERNIEKSNNLISKQVTDQSGILIDQINSLSHNQEKIRRKIKEEISHVNSIIKSTSKELHEEINLLQQKHTMLQEDTHGFMAIQSFGLDLSEIPLHRFVPLRVYLSKADQKQISNISRAIENLLNVFELEFSDEFPEIKGSWFKKWFARTKEVATESEVTERLEKIERAIEIKGLHKPQSEIDKNKAEAVAALIQSISNEDNVAIHVGSILLVKTNNPQYGNSIQVRTLTQKEMLHLEKNQKLLMSPNNVLEKLSEVNSHKINEIDRNG